MTKSGKNRQRNVVMTDGIEARFTHIQTSQKFIQLCSNPIQKTTSTLTLPKKVTM